LEIQDMFGTDGIEDGEEDSLAPMLMADFPPLDGQLLCYKVHGDEYLYNMLMIRFYLNVLDDLLVFCEDYHVQGLMLTVRDDHLRVVETYQPFITKEMQEFTDKGERTQVIIPTFVDTYDALVDLMDNMDRDFRQTLWRQQRNNPIIRAYLKSCSVLR
jgi:hypothetical protein